MKSFALILALALVGCVSTEGMTDKERREFYLGVPGRGVGLRRGVARHCGRLR